MFTVAEIVIHIFSFVLFHFFFCTDCTVTPTSFYLLCFVTFSRVLYTFFSSPMYSYSFVYYMDVFEFGNLRFRWTVPSFLSYFLSAILRLFSCCLWVYYIISFLFVNTFFKISLYFLKFYCNLTEFSNNLHFSTYFDCILHNWRDM